MSKEAEYEIGNNQKVVVRKDFYLGLWNVWYADSIAMKWAGPFRTKREATQRVLDVLEDSK